MPYPRKRPTEDRRIHTVQCTLTPAEFEHANACAESEGLSVASWLRTLVISQTPKPGGKR